MFSLMLTRGALCYLLCHFLTVFWGLSPVQAGEESVLQHTGVEEGMKSQQLAEHQGETPGNILVGIDTTPIHVMHVAC